MNNFKYSLEKNKQKIILGASVVGVIGIGFGTYFLITHNKTKEIPKNEQFVDTAVHKADFVIGGDKDGNVDLIKVNENKVVSSKKLNDKAIYSRENSLDGVMAYSNGTFTKLTEENGELKDKEIFKLETKNNIKSFKFSDKFIVCDLNDKLLIINLETKQTYALNISDVDSYVVAGSDLVYSSGNYVNKIDLNSKKAIKIDIGDKTSALFEMKGNIIAFNKFGNKNNKTTILDMKSNNLYIDKAHSHDNAKVYPVTPDNDDTNIMYIDRIENQVPVDAFYSLNLKGEQPTKERTVLSNNGEAKDLYSPDKTVATKGFVYSLKEGNIEIFGLRGGAVDSTIKINGDFFMPILK